MTATRGDLGFERKIGYSFLGLMTGNVASLVVFLLLAVLQRLDAFAGFRHVWEMTVERAAEMSLLFAIFSLPEWVAVGLPLVLLLRSEVVADFYWATAALIGTVLGVIGMLLFALVLDRGFATISNPAALRTIAPVFAPAALIAAVAFTVYCSLVKTALRKQAKENGAPSGAPPRSLVWFDL